MKRLALLLGSLLVVSAAASAKEVVPAPVVVEEAPVQIVEKEVIVYRDKEEGFRPNGYVNLQYRWYGNTEGQNRNMYGDWNSDNNYSRGQLLTKLNITENQSLEARTRFYNDLDKEGVTNQADDRQTKDSNEVRLRYFYNHGNLGDSKVNLTSRVQYEDKNKGQKLEYQARFNFADYMFNNDFVKTTDFTLAPKYMYAWADSNNDDYENGVGTDLYTMHQLPWGFSFEFNVYATQHFYGHIQEFGPNSKPTEERRKDKNFTVDVEAYIYNTTNLYAEGKYSLDFNFEGGYDQYNWSKEKQFGTKQDQHSKYSLYALPYIQLNYQATEFVNLYAAAGAEYRNWVIESEKSASTWRWQPTVWAGFNVAF